MKEEKKLFKKSKGFTLIEMLVVVLIIGILAAIALPQYKMAVTKSKVAAILPMMRHIKDSLMEWKLTKGSYCLDEECSGATAAHIGDIGIECPDGWNCNASGEMENDYWYCFPNEEGTGYIYCEHYLHNWDDYFQIVMIQPDDHSGAYQFAGMTLCLSEGSQSDKLCNSLGGKLLDNKLWSKNAYKL